MTQIVLVFVSLVVGAITTILVARKFKDEKSIKFFVRSTKVAVVNESHESDDISISYNGVEVCSLVRTDIFVWNSGDQPIVSADLVKSDPLSLNFEGGLILKTSKINFNRDAVDASLTCQDDRAFLGFELLDKDDALHFAVHWDQKGDASLPYSTRDPYLSGAVAGIPSGPIQAEFGEILECFRKHYTTRTANRFLIYAGIMGFLLFSVWFYPSLRMRMAEVPYFNELIRYILALSALFAGSVSAYNYYRVYKARVPSLILENFWKR